MEKSPVQTVEMLRTSVIKRQLRSEHQSEGVVILGKFVDALYLSYQGQMRDELAEVLRAKKEVLRANGDGEETLSVPELPGGPLLLLGASRGKYEFVLRNPMLYVEATTWGNLPGLRIQFETRVLYNHNFEALQAMADVVARFFLEPGFKVLVSRFDLAIDFLQGESWQLPERKDVITRAKKWGIDGDGPNPNTLSIGKYKKSSLMVQIYDKSEKVKGCNETWMHDVWQASGRYSEGLAVGRVEFRFFRKRLKALGINSIADLQSGLGDLVRFVVGCEETKSWIRVASPDTRGSRQDHRPSATWWKDICEAALDGMPTTRFLDFRPKQEPDLAHTEIMLDAYLERFMVLGGGEGLHPESPLEEFLGLYKERYLERLDKRGLTLREALEHRRVKLGIAPTFSAAC